MTTTEVAEVLRQHEETSVAIALGLSWSSDKSNYELVRGLAYVIPEGSDWLSDVEPLDYDYGQWRLLRGRVTARQLGDAIAEWFHHKDVALLGLTIGLPPDVGESARWDDRCHPSFASRTYRPAPYPCRHYSLRYGRHAPMSERGALVRPRLPYFPTIMEALSRLVDGADTPSQSGEDYSDLHLNMFVLDPRARIPRVTVRAGHAEVSVAGEVLPEMELKMYSNTSELSLALDPSRETYEFAWSEIPEYAEWVTTEGNEVIDRRIFSRHPQFGANVNVVTDYGDPTTLGYFLQEGETRTIEFKENLPNEEKAKRSLLETVCAFANTEGGTILIGVSDHGSVHGVAEDTRWKDRLTDIIRNRMEPVPLFTFQELDYKEARIYCIRVMAGNDRPYVVDIQDPKIYVRHGANDYVARRADLDEMYAAKQQSSILSVHLDDTPFSR